MDKPAAYIGCNHVCFHYSGDTPHVGGPITVGEPSVLIEGKPAAREGDMAICAGPPDKIRKGSDSVLIGGLPAARMGDLTEHPGGGFIQQGCTSILIG